MLVGQQWDTAGAVADAFVEGLIANLPTEPVVVNLNVPNVPVDEVVGWRFGRVGMEPPRKLAAAVLEPKEGHQGSFYVRMSWGDALELPTDSDGGAVENGEVSVTYLTRMVGEARADMASAEAALDRFITHR
jgi:5'-nucleotidase